MDTTSLTQDNSECQRMDWKKLLSAERLSNIRNDSDAKKSALQSEDIRSAFEHDFDQIIFSYPFRRLQNKTQVIPFPDYDFVHNRMTHSLEVASIGRSLGKLAAKIIFSDDDLKGEKDFNLSPSDIGALVAAACLAHDIGNPPFGHSGEEAISSFFHNYGRKYKGDVFDFVSSWYLSDPNNFATMCLNGTVWPDKKIEDSFFHAGQSPPECTIQYLKKCFDLLKFEGNANGFRIITQSRERGINPTIALLGTYSKYPRESYIEKNPFDEKDKPASQKKYGFFQAERELFKNIAEKLGLLPIAEISKEDIAYHRHPLAFLMEAADDIANFIIDFEDACRLELIDFDKPYRFKRRGVEKTPKQILIEITKEDTSYDEKRLNELRDDHKQIAYLRSKVTNVLIYRTFSIFEEQYECIMHGMFDAPLIECIEEKIKNELDLMKELVGEHVYRSHAVLENEIGGFEVMEHLIDSFSKTCHICYSCGEKETVKDKKVKFLLPVEYHPKEEDTPNELKFEEQYERFLKILDYVSGMTDDFAIDLYRKIKGMPSK